MWLHLLAILPLPLITAGAARTPADLAVRLEATGTSYRIIHHYSGDGPRRFVTGSTDKNCDQPIDVLVVDGKVTELYSMLPCGGMAFRQAQVVRPGEKWVIQGETSLSPGKHSVVARYCAAPESLKLVDPKLKSASQPPWWLGCVDSAAVTLSGLEL